MSFIYKYINIHCKLTRNPDELSLKAISLLDFEIDQEESTLVAVNLKDTYFNHIRSQ